MAGPFEVPNFKPPFEASGDLSAAQFRAVKLDANGQLVVAGSGDRIVGVLQDKPAAAGNPAEVIQAGISKARLGATVARGADVQIDANGDFITAAGGSVVGVCVHGGDVGQIGSVLLSGATGGSSRMIVPFEFEEADYEGGTSTWAVSPVSGRIKRVRTVTIKANTGAAVVGLELGGTDVAGSDVTIGDGDPIGTTDDSGEIADDPSNVVSAGDAIEVTSDGGASDGRVRGVIEIEG